MRERAIQARRLAHSVNDAQAVAGLLRYADEQDAKANELAATPVLPAAAAIPSGEPPIARAGAALKTEVQPDPEPEQKPEPSS